MGVKRSGGLSGKLKGLTDEMIRNLRPVIEVIAGEVQSDARISLTAGSASGNSGGKHQHVPSAPGTPPNQKSGDLGNGIVVEILGPLRARVVSTAPHGAIQELGGTINHPGGTPYFIKGGELVFVRKDSPAAARLPKTKPHRITLPERPYMRPAAQKNSAKGVRMMEAAIDKALKGGKFT